MRRHVVSPLVGCACLRRPTGRFTCTEQLRKAARWLISRPESRMPQGAARGLAVAPTAFADATTAAVAPVERSSQKCRRLTPDEAMVGWWLVGVAMAPKKAILYKAIRIRRGKLGRRW